MKKVIFLALILLFLCSIGKVSAQSLKGAPVPPEIENPEMLGINKEQI